MRHILVTGCNGTVGRNVVQSLLASGYQVVGVSIQGESALAHENFNYRCLDICDQTAVSGLLKSFQFDVLVHLAALVHVRSAGLEFPDYCRVNFRASENLFHQASRNGIQRIVLASTIEVYGPNSKDSVISEDAICRPQSDYARTKLLAEEALAQVGVKDCIDFAIMRLAPIYSNEFRLNLDSRLYLHPPIGYYISDGTYRLGLCCVRNVSFFVTRWIRGPSRTSGIFNIADSRSYRIKDLLQLERRSGRCRIALRLPLIPTLAGLAVREALYSALGRDSGKLTVGNFKKLIRSVEWDTKKAQAEVGALPWTLEETLDATHTDSYNLG